MHRAFSVIELKAVDTAARTFSGIATTPSTDRMGDVVDPQGASFALPIPLLLHHDHRLPVGNVTAADVTRSGINVRGRIAAVEEPGMVQSRLDEAWHSLKSGLLRGLSIGFRPLADGVQSMRGGGTKFTSFEILEVSLVTVPANADCTVSAIKHYFSSTRHRGGIPLITPGRSPVKLIRASAR